MNTYPCTKVILPLLLTLVTMSVTATAIVGTFTFSIVFSSEALVCHKKNYFIFSFSHHSPLRHSPEWLVLSCVVGTSTVGSTNLRVLFVFVIFYVSFHTRNVSSTCAVNRRCAKIIFSLHTSCVLSS